MPHELSILDTFIKLGIALGLGLLVGLQRERTDSKLAGIRTFPLTTIFGTISGLLAVNFGGWVLAASVLALMTIMVVPALTNKTTSQKDMGVTSEVAMLLMFVLGAYLVTGYHVVAVVMSGMIMVLLHLKSEMHSFARHIGDKDFKAIVQFVLISLVILPILPNQTFDPFQILNPFKIWLMVVLIVGISLAGYVLYKFLGPQEGSFLSGIVGGLISSTATTASYARRSHDTPKAGTLASIVIMIASSVVYLRVLVIIGTVAPHSFRDLCGPVIAMFVCSMVIAVGAWVIVNGESTKMPAPENPSELKPAIFFALLFMVVLIGVAIANKYFGNRGLYIVAAISGLTDMDAITITSVEMVNSGKINTGSAWRMIVIAAMANLVFKGWISAVLGNRKFFIKMALLFTLAFIANFAILIFWP